MVIMLTTVATEAAALSVGFAAVCRLAQLHVIPYDGVSHRWEWVLVYLLMALGGVFAFFEAAENDASIGALMLLAANGLFLWLSKATWTDGAPKYLERPHDTKP